MQAAPKASSIADRTNVFVRIALTRSDVRRVWWVEKTRHDDRRQRDYGEDKLTPEV
jgi:hypothetical protein